MVTYANRNVTWRRVTTKHNNGTTEQWQAVVSFTEGGKRHRKTKLFPTNQKLKTEAQFNRAARKWLGELDAAEAEAEKADELARLEAERAARVTVAQYINAYIDAAEKAGSIERHTVRDYRTIAKRICAAIGSTPMEDVTTEQIQQWENSLIDEGLAPTTVIKHHRVLNRVFKHAVSARVIKWNPCTAVLVTKKNRPQHNSLTLEGFARLAATLADLEPSPLVTSASIALLTGAREGEICALRWKDYDLNALTITIQQSIGKDAGKTYVKEAKTKNSQGRSIPVVPQLAHMLNRRASAQMKQLEAAGISPTAQEFGELYITGTVDGKFYSPLFLCKVWREFAESYGLVGTQGRLIRFHDLRHTYASVGIAAGADVRAISDILGHASPSFTLDMYADALPEAKIRASEKVSGVVTMFGNIKPYAQLAEAD